MRTAKLHYRGTVDANEMTAAQSPSDDSSVTISKSRLVSETAASCAERLDCDRRSRRFWWSAEQTFRDPLFLSTRFFLLRLTQLAGTMAGVRPHALSLTIPPSTDRPSLVKKASPCAN
jgi:hypothetical protein